MAGTFTSGLSVDDQVILQSTNMRYQPELPTEVITVTVTIIIIGTVTI